MNELLAVLTDPARSGAYWAPGDADVLDAARGSRLDVVSVDLRGVKAKRGLLDAFAAALEFPRWFGGNWDALEDCLGDLSWRKGEGRVLLIGGAGGLLRGDLETLRAILAECAHASAARRRPFFAVFTGARNALRLPELLQRKA
jgi:hypothetical protein